MMPNSEMSATYRPPGQGSGTPPLLRPETAAGSMDMNTKNGFESIMLGAIPVIASRWAAPSY